MTDRVNLTDLSRDQVEALCVHYEEALHIITALNNALIGRLGTFEDFKGKSLETLNEWSERVNLTHRASEQEILRIVAGEPAVLPSNLN